MDENLQLNQVSTQIEAQQSFEEQKQSFITGFLGSDSVAAKIALLYEFNTIAYRDYPEELTPQRRYFNSTKLVEAVFTHLLYRPENITSKQRDIAAYQAMGVLNTAFPDWTFDLDLVNTLIAYGNDVLLQTKYSIFKPFSALGVHRTRTNYQKSVNILSDRIDEIKGMSQEQVAAQRQLLRQRVGFDF